MLRSRPWAGLLPMALLAVLLLLGRVANAQSAGGGVSILVHSAPLAGSQYYALNELWSQLQVGDALSLQREADNPHDALAVRVLWRGRQLGYVPRSDNRQVAAALDAGETLYARISELRSPLAERNPWLRLRYEVFLRL